MKICIKILLAIIPIAHTIAVIIMGTVLKTIHHIITIVTIQTAIIIIIHIILFLLELLLEQ